MALSSDERGPFLGSVNYTERFVSSLYYGNLASEVEVRAELVKMPRRVTDATILSQQSDEEGGCAQASPFSMEDIRLVRLDCILQPVLW